jgi:hypothetical protein
VTTTWIARCTWFGCNAEAHVRIINRFGQEEAYLCPKHLRMFGDRLGTVPPDVLARLWKCALGMLDEKEVC